MPYVRLTILRPLTAQRVKAQELLRELDHQLTSESGMIMSFEFGESGQDNAPLGRVAVWETIAAANKAATSEHTLAIRAELQQLCREEIIENMTEVTHTHWTAAASMLPTEDSP